MAPEGSNGTAKERKERLRRRLVAARVLAGLGQKELAEKIQAMGYTRGYSARTIGDMERGETPIQPQSIAVLAEACGLPPEFFTVDFETLREQAPNATELLEERLTAIERVLGITAATQPGERPAPQPRGELGRRLAARRPTDEDPEQPQSPPAEDQQTGLGG